MLNYEFFSKAPKLNGDLEVVCPADIPLDISKKIQSTTLNIAKSLNMKGVFRVDYILAGEELYFLEINTNPEVMAGGGIDTMAKASGISVKDLLGDILEDADYGM